MPDMVRLPKSETAVFAVVRAAPPDAGRCAYVDVPRDLRQPEGASHRVHELMRVGAVGPTNSTFDVSVCCMKAYGVSVGPSSTPVSAAVCDFVRMVKRGRKPSVHFLRSGHIEAIRVRIEEVLQFANLRKIRDQNALDQHEQAVGGDVARRVHDRAMGL